MPATPIMASKVQQPIAAPALRCRPDLDKGIPIFRERRACAAETPSARRQENERPGIPPFLRRAITPTPTIIQKDPRGFCKSSIHINFSNTSAFVC